MSDLYVQKSDFRLSLFNNSIIVRNSDSEIVKEMSLNKVENILIFGDSQISTQLVKKLLQSKINIHYFSKVGQYLGGVNSYRNDDYEKQKNQMMACLDHQFCLEMTKKTIAAKIFLQKELLKAYDQDGLLDIDDLRKFDVAINHIGSCLTISEILGYEGRVAKSYFYYLGLMVPVRFKFHGRSRKPAKDEVNTLLNFGYHILYSFLVGYIKKVGLNPGIGFMHQNKRQHATLASDIMEPWRPIIIDDLMMQLLTHDVLLPSHFKYDDHLGCTLTSEGQKIFLNSMRSRMLEIHQYIELDKKRYTFPYTAELQLRSLVESFNHKNPHLFKDISKEK